LVLNGRKKGLKINMKLTSGLLGFQRNY